MTAKTLTFALFGKAFQDKKADTTIQVISFLHAHGCRVLVHKPFYDYLTQTLGLTVSADEVFSSPDFRADYALSIGGDGTYLRAAMMVGAKPIPIMGINTGRLGFLAEVLPSEVNDALGELISGQTLIEEHSVIQVEADGGAISGCPYALNDIAVLKRDNAAMISVRACVSGEYLVTYQADGVIVATPTGSTAYNLSNGGPILMPNDRNLCITPVAPHSLNIRPIVVSDEAVIRLNVESRSHNFLVAIDGRSEKVADGVTLTISRAPHTVKMVKRSGRRYFSTLREKLMWGADQR